MGMFTHQYTFHHAAHIHQHIARTYLAHLHHSPRKICHILGIRMSLHYLHRIGSCWGTFLTRCTRWCRNSLRRPSGTSRVCISCSLYRRVPSIRRDNWRDTARTATCCRLWTLRRSRRRTTRSSRPNILYHNCTCRCPSACRCPCSLRCRSSRCRARSLCRRCWAGSKPSACWCRTSRRSLRSKKIIKGTNGSRWSKRLTWILVLVLPPEFDVAFVLLGDRLALLLASRDVRAQHLLNLHQAHLAGLVATQFLLLPVSIATAVFSTLSLL